MVYNPNPPYEVLSTRTMDFGTLARLRRFSRFWDLFGNSGNFVESLPMLWQALGSEACGTTGTGSPFAAMLAWSDWLHAQGVKGHGIALPRQYDLLWRWAVTVRGIPADRFGPAMARDWRRPGRMDLPAWLEPFAGSVLTPRRPVRLPRRQARHLGSDGGHAPAVGPDPAAGGTVEADLNGRGECPGVSRLTAE